MSKICEAKKRLDSIIKKARVDLYKPIQIAEVLRYSRLGLNKDFPYSLTLADFLNERNYLDIIIDDDIWATPSNNPVK